MSLYYSILNKMVFYAPAHSGASISALATEVLGVGIFRFFCGSVRFASPLVDQLKPRSHHLSKLEADTNDAISVVGCTSYLKPAVVVIAERENVVSNIPFASDGPPEVIRGTTHFNIFKPRQDFRQPLKFLLAVL